MRFKVTAFKSEEFEVEALNEDDAIRKCHPGFRADYYEVEELDDEEQEDGDE